MSRNSYMETRIFVQKDTSAFPDADASKNYYAILSRRKTYEILFDELY